MPNATLIVGAVAYDPKVVIIWDGFREWFRSHDLAVDYVLYSQYERQVDALMNGAIDVAWNSPLAWVRARRLANAQGKSVRALVMRDSDQDLVSVVVTRADSGMARPEDLRGRRVGVGSVDSPQATLLPLSHLLAMGLAGGRDFEVRYFDTLGGKHGDHIGGERHAARAMAAGEVDAACMVDSNHLLFLREGTLPPDSTRVMTQTAPYDHCNFTIATTESSVGVRRFAALLLGMSYGDPEVRRLFDLEGLKEWREGRTTGYSALERAVDESSFYDSAGAVTAANYRY